jgi:hypothetical protein
MLEDAPRPIWGLMSVLANANAPPTLALRRESFSYEELRGCAERSDVVVPGFLVNTNTVEVCLCVYLCLCMCACFPSVSVSVKVCHCAVCVSCVSSSLMRRAAVLCDGCAGCVVCYFVIVFICVLSLLFVCFCVSVGISVRPFARYDCVRACAKAFKSVNKGALLVAVARIVSRCCGAICRSPRLHSLTLLQPCFQVLADAAGAAAADPTGGGGSGTGDASCLSRFVLLTHAVLKTHSFIHWLGCPALTFGDVVAAPGPALDAPAVAGVLAAAAAAASGPGSARGAVTLCSPSIRSQIVLPMASVGGADSEPLVVLADACGVRDAAGWPLRCACRRRAAAAAQVSAWD